MSDPTIYLDPDRRFSPNWYWESEDNRGVHYNSGVANKLAFLLTDGGSFNGQTVTGQGITPVAGLFYEAQANLLGPASDYFDLYAALRQAAKNQNWAAASRDSLEAATRAVEINVPGNVVEVFSDGFEGAFSGNWQVSVGEYWETVGGNTSATTWGQSSHRAATGNSSLYCAAGGPGPAPGPLYQPYMDAWVVRGPFSLDQAQAAWAEFDLFLDLEYPNDEVYWGVSTDGVNFDGYVVSPGPEGYSTGVEGTPGWSHELFNFKEIPGILGQPQVWLAFNFFSDQIVEYEGASIDNVSVLKAATAAPIGSFDTPADGSSGLTGTVSLQGWALDDLQVTQVSIYRDPVSGETPGPNGVHVGDATQVAGLRTDIEAAYPTYPYAYKAGWNFDLLWSTLPSAGQGTFVFRALAYDADGRSTLLGSRTLTGAPAAPAVLTVVRAGVGSGLVVSTPPGIDCGLDCTESYVANTAISLTAIPDAGSVLVGWSGGCVGTGLSCELTMDAAKSVTATFDLVGEPVVWTNRAGDVGAGEPPDEDGGQRDGATRERPRPGVLAAGEGYVEFTLPATSGLRDVRPESRGHGRQLRRHRLRALHLSGDEPADGVREGGVPRDVRAVRPGRPSAGECRRRSGEVPEERAYCSALRPWRPRTHCWRTRACTRRGRSYWTPGSRGSSRTGW